MPTYTHPDAVDQAIINDAFYGDLNLQDFQERYRLPASTAPEIYVEQLHLALDEINGRLADFKAEQELAGVAALTDLDATSSPAGACTRYYQAAVFAQAFAHTLPMLTTEYFNDEATGPEGSIEDRQSTFFARANHFLALLRGTTPASHMIEVV